MEPSIAVQICKAEKPDRVFEFVSELHKEIYVSGLKTTISSDYDRLAKKMGFDEKIFINELTENKFKQMAMQDFQEAGALGVDSYPAVLISIDGVVRELARGYMKWNDLEKLINAELLK
jgi:protein-disulfide isomerase-like protein with CxxC motif